MMILGSLAAVRPEGFTVLLWVFVNLSCFPTASTSPFQRYHDAAEAFGVGKKIVRLQENLSLFISVQKGEQHHVGSAQPRAFVGTKKGQTGVFKRDV